MTSAETIAELEARGLPDILGVRERTASRRATSFSTILLPSSRLF